VLVLDGSIGEGGGQVLRTALGLAALTGQALRVENVRAGREKPGLLRQHLTSVQAAAAICGADVSGAELGSQLVTFVPGPVRPGEYRFSIGTAGSTTLVVQTVLPALMTAGAPSLLTTEGGTHNPSAPCFEFLRDTFAPQLLRSGPRLALTLFRHGLHPFGGGILDARVTPVPQLAPLSLLTRGELRRVRALACISHLPQHVATRELRVIATRLSSTPVVTEIVDWPDARGAGNVLLVQVEHEHITETITAFGARGLPAEDVGERAAAEALRYLAGDAPAGEHLADQLLLPLALAGGEFRALGLTGHARTNLQVIERFLPARFQVTEEPRGTVRVRVEPRPDRSG
jgi:RNA 3'-terminal phosphate cyclase (ATP)